jgi:3'-5' exonuclease
VHIRHMATLIFDIETVGEDFDLLDETTRESLTRWIRRESSDEGEYEAALGTVKDELGLSPLTGEIVAIGILDAERDKGAVYFQQPGAEGKMTEDGPFKFESMSEKNMLAKFWEVAEKYDTFVSFNGRSFDVPYLMIRSAIHDIRPSKNLLANRYVNYQPGNAKHIDLLEQLSFYGALRRRGSLHLWTRAFGIESPKSGGISGDDVGKLFREGKCEDVARYNSKDLRATLALYRKFTDYLSL